MSHKRASDQLTQWQKLSLSALFLALCWVLPFFTGQIRVIGKMLLPMHLPVLLCAVMCGPFWAMGVGAAAPVLRSLLFAMPKLFPTAFCMSFELLAYGLCFGFLLRVGQKPIQIPLWLICTQIAGRLLYASVMFLLSGLGYAEYSLAYFFGATLLEALPGMILQLILLPLFCWTIQKNK